MVIESFLEQVNGLGIEFFTGVPDSLLAPLCDTLYARYGVDSQKHIVAANEGGAVGLAAGHYIATGKPALVYMQNSGLGNTVNPIASMLHEQVYGIPCLFVVGWRGEPGIHDEPQHKFQGVVTLEQLELLGIQTFVLAKDTSEEEVGTYFRQCEELLSAGKCAAIVVKKGALSNGAKVSYRSHYQMTREKGLELVLNKAGADDVFVSTTGKVSRELFELRESRCEGHDHDFLTVGSMGHALMIALGISVQKPERTVWCIDGDGASLMHLGGMEIAAKAGCKNLIHVIMNNGAHESVGGMPVAGGQMNISALAKAAGYDFVASVEAEEQLRSVLANMQSVEGTRFLEIKVALGARTDLGRPTTTPRENLAALRECLR